MHAKLLEPFVLDISYLCMHVQTTSSGTACSHDITPSIYDDQEVNWSVIHDSGGNFNENDLNRFVLS